ncbi:MAG: uroporphyrinogen-III synthase [Croceibacterium sp.]
MSTLVLTIRPQPGSAATVAAGSEAGLCIEACPLFEIRPLAWMAPPPDSIDGVLLGSANALRHGGLGLGNFRGKLAFVVGTATASAAESAGLQVARCGQGQLQPLVDTLDPPLRLLRLTGADHVPIIPPAGITIDTRIAYESVPLPIPAALAARLQQGALVLLHSAVAASHFTEQCDAHGVPRAAIRLAALGPRIASAAGYGWAEVRSAPEPAEGRLLALATDMCHET